MIMGSVISKLNKISQDKGSKVQSGKGTKVFLKVPRVLRCYGSDIFCYVETHSSAFTLDIKK
jgi:hypothetical protein